MAKATGSMLGKGTRRSKWKQGETF
jgi:hypothetical protein